MTIAEVREKCKSQVAKIPKDVLAILVLILACFGSFGLGFMSGRETGQEEPAIIISSTTGSIVASKSGTKYYDPACPAAERISDANKVWFISPEAAEEAGYTKAVNCP